jgi:acyl-CoA dehydrogenase
VEQSVDATAEDRRRTVARIADEVAAPASAEVDRDARFPHEALAALREAGLLHAALPAEVGGGGLDLREISELTQRLARGCGATSMVFAMHQAQIASVAACLDAGGDAAAQLARRITGDDALVASVTSEVGIGGDVRRSNAAVEPGAGGTFSLEKRSPTISYAEHAEAYLVTARRTPDSAPDDQVAVLLWRDAVVLERTGTWDAMGMRGTVSPGYRIASTFPAERVLPLPFGDIAARAMVPWSHVLWASCWYGLALEAFLRARRMVRKRDAGADPRLAEAGLGLSALRAGISEAIDGTVPASGPMAITALTRLNDLKVASSRTAVDVATLCLEITGMAGYQERNPVSVARILRDLYSARLMIGNERILASNAELALVRDA